MINNTRHYHSYFPYCTVVVLDLQKVISNNDDDDDDEEEEEEEEEEKEKG